MHFSTNSEGFRGPERRNTRNRPVLFLGDSFSAGYGVNDGEEYPDLVRKGLADKFGADAIPVVNAAMGNIGNGYWIKSLQAEGHRLHPLLVVLQFCGNDFEDNIEDHLFDLSSKRELYELPPLLPGMGRRMQDLVESVPGLSDSYLMSMVRQALVESPGEGFDTPALPKDRLTYAILEKTVDICSREHWPVLGLLVEVSGDRLAQLMKLFERHAVSLILVPKKAERPELYYQIDGHWNTMGHAFVASLVLDRMYRDFNIVPQELSADESTLIPLNEKKWDWLKLARLRKANVSWFQSCVNGAFAEVLSLEVWLFVCYFSRSLSGLLNHGKSCDISLCNPTASCTIS